MKVLMINKFLHPNGGAETYTFKLGNYLKEKGHEVQYFGMEHKGRCVGNAVNAYTSDMDFHSDRILEKLTYPIKTIYSREARVQIRKVLDDFKPDVCHINNFNYQLTPSIILEINKWRKQTGKQCRIVFTAHDYQLICPNHMCHNPNTHENCEKCLGGHFFNCIRGRCIHGSTVKSVIGTIEAVFWNKSGVYKHFDTIICCSNFMKTKMDINIVFAKRTVLLHNFTDIVSDEQTEKKDYVLYFGRYSEEKGIKTLVEVCRHLPDIHFIFAGQGPLDAMLEKIPNITNVGFKDGAELNKLIKEAQFSVYPSEWNEPFGLSIIESIRLGTPVIGANSGGVAELIKDSVTGTIFEAGNKGELYKAILDFWDSPEKVRKMSDNCKKKSIATVGEYCEYLVNNVYKSA